MIEIPEFTVILVEPKHPGNVGAIARAMSNFGFSKLWIVSEEDFSSSDEALRRSTHGKDILLSARYFSSLDDALGHGEFTRVIGTTGKTAWRERRSIRVPVYLPELTEHLSDDDRVAILFGREDHGLRDDELRRCNLLVTIPSSQENPVLNLSHAATIVFYTLFLAYGEFHEVRVSERAGLDEIRHLLQSIEELLDVIEYPEHKRQLVMDAFSRIIGRSGLTKREYLRIIGVFTRTTKKLTGKIP